MRQLVLVSSCEAVLDARLVRFAAGMKLREAWRSELARLIGAPHLAYAAPAEIARLSLDEARLQPASRSACLATPVHIHIGRYGGRLSRYGALPLDDRRNEL